MGVSAISMRSHIKKIYRSTFFMNKAIKNSKINKVYCIILYCKENQAVKRSLLLTKSGETSPIIWLCYANTVLSFLATPFCTHI